jgi:hypothetical protein
MRKNTGMALLPNGFNRFFKLLLEILFSVHLNQSGANIKPMANDLVHGMPWQCTFVLTMWILGAIY